MNVFVQIVRDTNVTKHLEWIYKVNSGRTIKAKINLVPVVTVAGLDLYKKFDFWVAGNWSADRTKGPLLLCF